MRKLLVTLIALGFSGVAMAGIGTSGGNAAHNFLDGQCFNYTTGAVAACAAQETVWNTSGELCKVCHVPHEKVATYFTEAQLWNKTISTQDYVMYNEGSATGPFGTIDGGQVTDAGSTTRLCMSCHDGTTAIDSFGGHAGAGVTIATATAGYDSLVNKGTNFTTSHPVSMEYSVGGTPVDDDLQPLGTLVAGVGTTADLLEGSGTLTVECSSCHEPHQDRSTGNDYLLIIDNAGSALCLACHNK